jgi:hypothetical protein
MVLFSVVLADLDGCRPIVVSTIGGKVGIYPNEFEAKFILSIGPLASKKYLSHHHYPNIIHVIYSSHHHIH